MVLASGLAHTHEDFAGKVEVETSSDRSFGVVFFFAFSIYGLWPLLREPRTVRFWALIAGAIFLLLALVAPKILAPLNRLWTKLGLLLGRITFDDVIDVLQESTPRLIAHRESAADPWKRGKLERLRMLLAGAIAAATRVGLSMNVPKAKMKDVIALLPDAGAPTISPLADADWVDIMVVVQESFVRDLLPRLHAAGARLFDDTRDVLGRAYSSGLRIWHQAARAEHLAQTANLAHHVRRRDCHIEFGEAILNLLDPFVGIGHDIGPGFAGDARAFTLREHENAHGLSQAVW